MFKKTIVVEGNQLRYYDNFGFRHDFTITSGRDGKMNPKIENYGPIPPGKYVMKVDDIAGGWIYCLYWEAIKRQDWGVYRVPLTPTEDTETYGRYGFALHGGFTPGSAGCIDVGTPNDLLLFAMLKLSFKEEIWLEVKPAVLGNFDYVMA